MCERVLVVDDEQNVLSAINRMLLDEEYELNFALSGEEALAKLKDNSAQVIISDMRMPVMNGVEFLKKSREICPNAIRIVLSGQADISDIMDSINHGGIWRYISKPWDDRDFKITIRNALELYNKNNERIRLLKELERKNSELQILNEHLEQKVRERTKLIDTQNALLNMLIENSEWNSFYLESCKSIGSLLNTESIYLYKKFGNEEIVTRANMPTEEICKTLRDAGKNVKDYPKNRFLFNLSRSDSLLGSVLIDEVPETCLDRVPQIEKNIIPILSLALSQQKVELDTPDMLSNIDDFIGTI